MKLTGKVRLGLKTKKLVKSLKPGEIAVIFHRDIDQLAAESLITAKVKAIINAYPSISGKYPNLGPERLLEAKIPIVDGVGKDIFDKLEDGDEVFISDGHIKKDKKELARGNVLTSFKVDQKLKEARANLEGELNKFIDNTLEYAKREKGLILGLNSPEIDTDLAGKDALIVVRGKEYREDLEAVVSYIREVKPVLIGVDGGADALLEYGFKPHIIIGDMDSVSDNVLACGAEIIVHAYPDGKAPGMKKVKELDLEAKKFPAPGTSEDIALLLACEKGAELIVAVGTHTTMVDFLEKGRPGMASTFLARLKVGSKLVDAKGVNKLYQSRIKAKYLAQLIVAALVPIIIVITVSPQLQQLFKLFLIKLRFSLGF